jgi:hypothetical protein
MIRKNRGVNVFSPLPWLGSPVLVTCLLLGPVQVLSQTEPARPQVATGASSSSASAASTTGSPNPAAANSDQAGISEVAEATKTTALVSEPVTFVQISDAHLFDGGKSRTTVQEARQEQDDNWNAFHWALRQTNQLIESGTRVDFVVFTGDLGLEFVRRPNDPACWKVKANPAASTLEGLSPESGANPSGMQPNADEFEKAQKDGWLKLFSFEEAAKEVAGEFRLLRVAVVYLVPGNNDLVEEDQCDLQRYKDFVALLGKDIGKKSPRIVDLTAAQPVPEINGFSLLGVNSASFKKSSNHKDRCAVNLGPGCPQYEMDQLQAATKSNDSLYLIFTHIPDLKDPYSKNAAWDLFPAASLSAWRDTVKREEVAGIFAGHFHDSRRFLYATRSDGTGLSVDDVDDKAAPKTWVAPPLALKKQEKASVTARGFVLVRAQRVATPARATASISVIPFWFSGSPTDRCHYVLLTGLVLLLLLLATFVLRWFYRRPRIHRPTAGSDGLASAYPAILTAGLLLAMAALVWEVMDFATTRLQVPLYYALLPIFGAVGGAVGSMLRGDNGENKIVLSSVETPSRIRAGIVGDVAIGIGGAATVVFLFERALPIEIGKSTSYALLISISFVAGVFGRNIIELARQKLLEQKIKEEIKKNDEATLEASKLKEQGREAIGEKNFPQALKFLAAALQRDPTFIPAYIEKGRALRRIGNLHEALATLKEALGKDPDNTKVLYNMACYKTLLKFPKDEILADLRRAVGEPGLRILAATDTDFDTIRHDKDFKDLLLPQIDNRTGKD